MKDVHIDGIPEGDSRSFGQKLKRWLLIIGVILVTLLIGAIIFVWYNLAKLGVNPLDFGPLAATNGRTNILVLGVGDEGHAGQNLSDTMMVISLNHQTKEVAMIGIPRDLRVNIPGYGSAKINSANARGGPALAQQTVANNFGIPIHYYIKTDFTGLEKAVDAVGGIDITVKERLYDPDYPCPDGRGACGIDIKPGDYHMDGATALQYSRCRKGTCGSDFGRAERQQEVIQKLQQKVAQPSVYLNLKTDAELLTTLRAYSQTNMSVGDFVALGRFMNNPPRTINFVFSTAPDHFLRNGGGSDLVPVTGNFRQIQAFVQNIFTAQIPDSN